MKIGSLVFLPIAFALIAPASCYLTKDVAEEVRVNQYVAQYRYLEAARHIFHRKLYSEKIRKHVILELCKREEEVYGKQPTHDSYDNIMEVAHMAELDTIQKGTVARYATKALEVYLGNDFSRDGDLFNADRVIHIGGIVSKDHTSITQKAWLMALRGKATNYERDDLEKYHPLKGVLARNIMRSLTENLEYDQAIMVSKLAGFSSKQLDHVQEDIAAQAISVGSDADPEVQGVVTRIGFTQRIRDAAAKLCLDVHVKNPGKAFAIAKKYKLGSGIEDIAWKALLISEINAGHYRVGVTLPSGAMIILDKSLPLPSNTVEQLVHSQKRVLLLPKP